MDNTPQVGIESPDLEPSPGPGPDTGVHFRAFTSIRLIPALDRLNQSIDHHVYIAISRSLSLSLSLFFFHSKGVGRSHGYAPAMKAAFFERKDKKPGYDVGVSAFRALEEGCSCARFAVCPEWGGVVAVPTLWNLTRLVGFIMRFQATRYLRLIKLTIQILNLSD